MTAVVLCCKTSLLSFTARAHQPRFAIDGQLLPFGAWGQNMLAVVPGWHHLRVWHSVLWARPGVLDREHNVADIRLHVAEHQVLRVVYKTRWNNDLGGKLTAV